MNRRNWMVLLLAVLLLSACGRQSRVPTIRVGVTLYQQEDTFLTTLSQELEKQAGQEEERLGAKINLNFAYGRGNQSLQNEQVARFLEQGCDVLCVNIVDRTAAAGIIDQAQAADVPVIFFNREPVREDLERWDHAYYVGLPADQAGRLQGRIVAQAWKEDPALLDRSGDGVLQYVMLEGEPGHQDALLRTEYSIKTLTALGVRVEKLDSDTADWQRGLARLRMQQWIQDYGHEIELVLANNDDMALGAIDALLSAGWRREDLPFIVGADATPPGLEALRSGTMQATVVNDAPGQAEQILSVISCLLSGGDPAEELSLSDGKYAWLAYQPITEEDLEAG